MISKRIRIEVVEKRPAGLRRRPDFPWVNRFFVDAVLQHFTACVAETPVDGRFSTLRPSGVLPPRVAGS